MARCLIIGGGCRGLELASQLRSGGHAVRITTRDPARAAAIEAAGAEPFIGDPDRIGTIAPALAHVGVAFVLLGTAAGTTDQLAALHGTRLDMLIERTLDTTVRGVVYEQAGSVDPELLAHGAQRIRAGCERSLIPYVMLDADPSLRAPWLAQALAAVETVLGG